MSNRIILTLSLAGMIVAAHLWTLKLPAGGVLGISYPAWLYGLCFLAALLVWVTLIRADPPSDLRAPAAISFGGLALLISVLVFVDHLGTRPLDEDPAATQITRAVGAALPLYIDPARLSEMRTCRYDDSFPTIDPAALQLTDFPPLKGHSGLGAVDRTPIKGAQAAPTAVTVFYDPNCPHCKDYHPQLKRLVEQYQGRATFTVVPFMLWKESLTQVEALELAREAGKYNEMWDALLANQPPDGNGLTAAQLTPIFQALSLPTDNLSTRLAEAKAKVQSRQHHLYEAGIRGAPSIYINGEKVAAYNASTACVAKLLKDD
jgi:thiol-disulfide isomerase/thioredoxin